MPKFVDVTLMEYQVVKYRVPLEGDESDRGAVEHLIEASPDDRAYTYEHQVLNDGDIWIDERKE